MNRASCATKGTHDEDGEPLVCDLGGAHYCLRIGPWPEGHTGAHRCCWCGKEWWSSDE